MGSLNYQLIVNQKELEKFTDRHRQLPWMCFDTEFVGERRYETRLCLIQVASDHGFFLIDPFEILDLSPFLDLIENPGIKKIAHAGENDYRLLYNNYGVLPRNIFDTQVAAGFVGYKYPLSFKRLAEREIEFTLDKGYTIANWESRPFTPKQLKYALNDVVPLKQLHDSLAQKLDQLERRHWAEQEFAQQEKEKYFYQDPYKEVLNNDLMKSLYPQGRIFLLRLLMWRTEMARKRNHSKEMVLPKKYVSHIVRGIGSGKDALTNNRRIPRKIIDKNWPDFKRMYTEKVSDEEQEVLDRIPSQQFEDPSRDLLLDLIYLIIKHKTWESKLAIELAFPKSWLKALPCDYEQIADRLSNSWRKQWLGDVFIDWIRNFPKLKVNFSDNKLEIIT